MADFLVALADFDRQRLWVPLGHSSVFYYLHRDLGLSTGAAHYRKVAAHHIQRFPEVVELAKVITPENIAEVLPGSFTGRSRRRRRWRRKTVQRPWFRGGRGLRSFLAPKRFTWLKTPSPNLLRVAPKQPAPTAQTTGFRRTSESYASIFTMQSVGHTAMQAGSPPLLAHSSHLAASIT